MSHGGFPNYLPILKDTRFRSHSDCSVSVTLVHKNGDERKVESIMAYRSPPRIEIWWGNGAGMYTLDLVSNKLLRAELWRAKNLKQLWLAWFEAVHVKTDRSDNRSKKICSQNQ